MSSLSNLQEKYASDFCITETGGDIVIKSKSPVPEINGPAFLVYRISKNQPLHSKLGDRARSAQLIDVDGQHIQSVVYHYEGSDAYLLPSLRGRVVPPGDRMRILIRFWLEGWDRYISERIPELETVLR